MAQTSSLNYLSPYQTPSPFTELPPSFSQARKRHININFFVRLVPVFTGFVPGTNPVCPWDKSGEKQGQTQEFSLFYTVEARFHRVCPWDKPGLSQGQSRGRRAAPKVYVKKVYVAFFARYFHRRPRLFKSASSHPLPQNRL